MIQDLRYAVTFPTNGVSLSGQLSFQPGSTAITGDNGAGKSFIAEMIRYGLFGKKALRGPASDYKTLDMTLGFSVGDVSYSVKRGKKEELVCWDGDEQLAVGADAVNKKIVEILGFNLEVFDVVCAANQKESERLTRLTPAKRKELIDDVVGLTAQEAVEKACRDEANGLNREAEALTRSLVLPTEPEKPAGYRKSEVIHAELRETKALMDRRGALQLIIDAVPPEPVKPTKPCPDIEELEAHERERVAQEAHRLAVERQVATMPTTTLTPEQLKQAEALADYDAEIRRRGPRPDYSHDELTEWLSIWEKKGLLIHDAVTCPNCKHEFLLDRPDVDIEAIEKLPTPPINRQLVENHLRRWDFWHDEPKEPEGERLTPQEIAAAQAAFNSAPMRAALEKELSEMGSLADRSAELAEARELHVAWELYNKLYDKYDTAVAQAQSAQHELDHMDAPVHTVAELDAAFVAARVYETQLTNYSEQKQRFDDLTKDIAEKQERAKAFAAGAKGLVEARRTLKAFLAPSLSRVASHLIRQMTVNALRPLSSIEVDEDMNITADGQDVSTFNGAHATMINLALRLALGQVLVSRVFPLFIGDEIDSDATPANSQAIADGLMACKEQLKQIILISHKRLEGVDEEILL